MLSSCFPLGAKINKKKRFSPTKYLWHSFLNWDGMKSLKYLVVVLLGLSAACQAPAAHKEQLDSTVTKQDTAVGDAGRLNVDSSKLVVAGKQAGKIYLGQYMEEVTALLGRPDDGDAAMGSALGIWYNGVSKADKRNPTVIFSSYRDSNMVIKAVKQVSVAAPEFKTADGIGKGAGLAQLLKVYPSLQKIETYVDAQKDTVFVYDSLAEGIAFDLQKDTCTAITVHVKNRPANAKYLSVHPDWKRL